MEAQLLVFWQILQRTAADMTKLLIAGKRKEALQHATEGQLWGPALLLAWQLGEKVEHGIVHSLDQLMSVFC